MKSLVIVLGSAAALQAQSDLIDFETIPEATPAEGLEISDQFEATLGVSFSLEGGGYPVLAERGPRMTAFEGPRNGADIPEPGQNVGSFFLTDDGRLGYDTPAPLIITYSSPVSAASGAIIDIDRGEGWTVQAWSNSDQLLEEVVISDGDPGTGDGLATQWSFDRSGAEIHKIRVVLTEYGDPRHFAGLAFDLFSPAASNPLPLVPLDIALVVELTFESEEQNTYRIDCSPDLQQWQTYLFPIDGTGSEISLCVPISSSRKFFRAVLAND